MGADYFLWVWWGQRHEGTGKQGKQRHRWSRRTCLVRYDQGNFLTKKLCADRHRGVRMGADRWVWVWMVAVGHTGTEGKETRQRRHKWERNTEQHSKSHHIITHHNTTQKTHNTEQHENNSTEHHRASQNSARQKWKQKNVDNVQRQRQQEAAGESATKAKTTKQKIITTKTKAKATKNRKVL